MDNLYDNGGFLQDAYTTLDWEQLRAAHRIPCGVIANYKEIKDEARDDLILELNAFVLGKRFQSKDICQTETVHMDFPASPWQFFKDKHSDTWWLRWFVNKFPVLVNEFKEDVVFKAVWDIKQIYPENTLNARLGAPIIIEAVPRVNWRVSL